MSKSGAVNAKIARPVVAKRIEKPIKNEKPSTKREEIKEKPNSNAIASSSKKTVAATKKIPSNQDGGHVMTKPQTQSKTVVTKPKQATPIAPTTKPKIISTTANKITRQQPMRAVHQVQTKKPVAEKNVMNTIHNVTVASPPPVRKEQTNIQILDDRLPREREPQSQETIPRERTKTRTLGPEEVVILKQSQNDQKLTNLSDSIPTTSFTKIEQKPLIIQEPVAFEITFEKPVTTTTNNSSSEHQQVVSDGDYEDDFDSYESDFETESSASSQTASSSNKSEDDSRSSGSPAESTPVVPLPKRVDDDRDFDSGTFELKGVAEKVQLDSIDERELHSEGQNDSGFGYNNASPSPIDQSNSTSSSIFTKPLTKTTYNKRGMELMKKINLDTMSFSLFELKPLSYDLYMKIYGHKNTNQSSTQTLGNMIDQDAQTDTKARQSMWTQYPPNFAIGQASSDRYHQDRIGCGEGFEDVITVQTGGECLFEKSLKIINRTNGHRDAKSTKPIDYERLNFFLQKSAITMSAICDASIATNDLQKSDSTFSDGFFRISVDDVKILDNTAVYYMYSNPTVENIVYLTHRKMSASRTHDNSFVSVWNVMDAMKPIHILSCWSLIICLEVHHNFQDLVIGGLTDGCVAVWNCNESTFWHQNNNQETLPPTHIVSPSIDTKQITIDFGCIVSVKSLHPMDHHAHNDNDFKSTQICSLHEYGILTVWTVLQTNPHSTNLESSSERKIDHRSPWSKIQLIQSSIVDLTAMNLSKRIRPKSGFEKKKMYFESNLFNDAVLRELHDFDVQKDQSDQSESFRCVDMEYHEDGIVIATNKSFLIFVAGSLNKDSLRKIIIDDSNLLHATKLKSLDDILLVGLTDGSVKVIRVKSSNLCRKFTDNESKPRPGAHFVQDNFNAKSCAIQNIIKEERKFLADKDATKDSFKHQSENSIDNSTVTQGNRFINNQILLPAMSSNRDFVRWLDVSVNLNCLISLCGERLRIINFENSVEDREAGESYSEIGFATIVFGFNHREYLVNFEGDSVRVHLLRKRIL